MDSNELKKYARRVAETDGYLGYIWDVFPDDIEKPLTVKEATRVIHEILEPVGLRVHANAQYPGYLFVDII